MDLVLEHFGIRTPLGIPFPGNPRVPRKQLNRFPRKESDTMRKLLLFFVAVCALSVSVAAQTSSTGTLTGVVKDEKGDLVPNATVTVTNLGTNASRTVQTSGEGVYEITLLPPGNYRLDVEAPNFGKFTQDPVVVNVLARATIDAVLKPAGA